jgi:type IV pilus assembly protein PilM
MAKKITTLFIRDTGIYLLMTKGSQVEKWASSPLEPGLVSQGLVLDEDKVAEKVKQLFKETGAKTTGVTIGLSGHDSLYRILTLPELPDAILPEAVKREARRTIPTPLEEVYFSWQRLPSPTKGETRVFLATYPRNLVDALIRTLRKAGVKVSAMDLAPLALCRIPDVPRAIIVNARLDHLDVAVISDRLPQVIRRLVLPGEAESLEEKLPLIAEEFKRTVTFYNSGHLDKPLDTTVPVFVCGDLVEAPDTWQSVVGGGAYPVSVLPSAMEAPEGFNANEFMVNIGLALKELLPAKEEANFSIVNFNALPEVYVPPRFSVVRVLIPVVTIIGVGLIIFLVVLIMTNRASIATLRDEVTAAETNVRQQQTAVSSLRGQISPLQTIADQLNSRAAILERGRATVYEDLSQIKKLAEGKVTLDSVKHDGSSVTVQGTASDEDNIFKFARDLRALKDVTGALRFSQVWISSVTGSGTTLSFQLSLTK